MTVFSKRIPAMVATVLGTGLALACAATGVGADSRGTPVDQSASQPSRNALLGTAVAFRGDARPGASVAVQRLDDGAWTTVATAVAGQDGRYVARWRANHIGVFQMRTVPGDGAEVRASSVTKPLKVVVYKPATATWFGRGIYGHKTACGQTLSPTLMGVAHKTLPCGTKVSFLFRGRTITVPVVDRGPFGKGVSWDLTTAAADALGFTEVGKGTVGAVSLRRSR
jgi:rare lipoprotein A (peptidoglycan hydrolase)